MVSCAWRWVGLKVKDSLMVMSHHSLGANQVPGIALSISAVHMLQLILTGTLFGRCLYQPHFIGKKTESHSQVDPKAEAESLAFVKVRSPVTPVRFTRLAQARAPAEPPVCSRFSGRWARGEMSTACSCPPTASSQRRRGDHTEAGARGQAGG